MNELLQWIGALLRKLQPRQATSGDSTVQVERAGGNVNVDNSQRPVTMNVTNVFYSAQMQTQQRAANGVANEAQREVLAVLRQLSEEAKLRVLSHMHKKYGTKKVVDIDGPELKHLKRYMEVTLQNERRKA